MRIGVEGMKHLAMAVLPIVGFALPVQAQTVPQEAFLVMDIDQSGQVDAVEFGVAMGAAFAHADKDADGILTAEEATVLSLPNHVDADGNGQVTLGEYLASVRSDFSSTDTNDDSVLVPSGNP